MCHPRHPTMHQRTPTLRVSHTPPTTRYRYPMIMMPHTNNRVPKQAIHPQKQTISAHQPPAGPLRQQKVKLLRKEVIQPHLPVRLPCYDFVPIANPTFDHSPHQTVVRPWASGVTNFHDVTGGVYKARERIHRSIADLRLLATPTSWSRVADSNPN